jgi:hypothetical protein
MIGRHRPGGAGEPEQIAEGDAGCARARPLDEEVAEPVAIAAEILVAALRDQRLLGRLDDHPRARGIGLQPVAEALIGKVDEGDQPALRDEVGDGAPLVEIEIGAGRIVAAAVQQDEIARLGPPERVHHPVEAQSAALAGIIRISDQLDAGGAEQRRMIGPGRLADEDACLGVRPRDQVGAEPQRAAAARRLQPDDAIVVARAGAEHDRLDQSGETGVAGRAEIGLGLLRVGQDALGRLDALQDRRVAGGVAVDADADVDLGRARIGGGERDQGDQAVGGLLLEPVQECRRLAQYEPLFHLRLRMLCPLFLARAPRKGLSYSAFFTRFLKRTFHVMSKT